MSNPKVYEDMSYYRTQYALLKTARERGELAQRAWREATAYALAFGTKNNSVTHSLMKIHDGIMMNAGTTFPSASPSESPSASLSPSRSPSISPSASLSPSLSPSKSPSLSPSKSPSKSPSVSPSTSA